MKTIELTIDETLLAQIDSITQELSLTRAAFIHRALEAALRQQTILAQEYRHAEGYNRHPIETGEFDEWESEQIWEQS